MFVQVTYLPDSPGILKFCQSSLFHGQHNRVLAPHGNLRWCATIRKYTIFGRFFAVPLSSLSSRPLGRILLGTGGHLERIQSVHCRISRSWSLLSLSLHAARGVRGSVLVPDRNEDHSPLGGRGWNTATLLVRGRALLPRKPKGDRSDRKRLGVGASWRLRLLRRERDRLTIASVKTSA